MKRNVFFALAAGTILVLAILIALSNAVNLGALLGNGGGPFNLAFSLFYLLVWLLLLALGVAGKLQGVWKLYLIFWAAACLYFALYMLVLDTPLATLWYLGVLVFLMPIMGLQYPYASIQEFFLIDFFYSEITLPFLTVSLLMLLLGIAAKRRLRQQ